MKKKKIFALMAAALSLAACSTNDVADIIHDDADNVVNVASVTRSGESGTTTSTSPMTASFHLINITQASKRNVNFEADFTYDNNTNQYTQVSGSKVVWYNVKDADGNETPNEFKAFSPMKTDGNNASFDTFNLPTDQSTATLLQSADWMTANTMMTKSEAQSNNGLSLNFKHKYAKLCFTIDPQDDITESDLSVAEIKVLGSITPYNNSTSTSKTIEAIVEPKAYTPNDEIINITLDNETFSLKFPQDITFAEGKQYNYSLKLGHNAITISSVSVSDWESGSVTPGKENEATNGNNSLMFTFKGNLTGAKLRLVYHMEPQSSNPASLRGATGTPGGVAPQATPLKIYNGLVEIKGESTTTDNDNIFSWDFPLEIVNNNNPLEIALTQFINMIVKSDNPNGTVNCLTTTNGDIIPGYTTLEIVDNNGDLKKDIRLEVSGDLRSLVAPDNLENAYTGNAKFKYLFKDCKQLKSFEKIQLNEMAEGCCEGMFQNSGLKQSPELPNKVSEDCYKDMYKDCDSLKLVSFSCDSLAPGCYSGALSGAVNLEYLKIGTKEESFDFEDNDELKENPPFKNFVWQNDTPTENPGGDDGTQGTQSGGVAGSQADSRTLVISQSVYNSLSEINELPDIWKNNYPNTTVIFQNTDTGDTPGPEGPVM